MTAQQCELNATECALKNAEDGKFYVLCILPQLKNMVKEFRSIY